MEEDEKVLKEIIEMNKLLIKDDPEENKTEYCKEAEKENRAIKNVLDKLERKDKIINKAIEQIEYIRQYFSEDCQADFIVILEILKDKKVIDW